jgi:hypothetical protein
MAFRLLAAFLIAVFASLSGCASAPRDVSAAVASEPMYDGIYRLAFTASGNALYYRFYPGGVVVSVRSDAPAADVFASLSLENEKASRGNWTASDGELRVGVEEGSVTYDSRFDLRANGRIALRGLPRTFEFVRADASGGVVATR